MVVQPLIAALEALRDGAPLLASSILYSVSDSSLFPSCVDNKVRVRVRVVSPVSTITTQQHNNQRQRSKEDGYKQAGFVSLFMIIRRTFLASCRCCSCARDQEKA